mgnify:FL=1
MKFTRRPESIEAVQWFPPGHEKHTPIKGVERGPREDQPWGFVNVNRVFVAVEPGDWVELNADGVARFKWTPRTLAAMYEPAEVRK